MRSLAHALTLFALVSIWTPASAQAAIIIDFEAPFPSNPELNMLFNDPSLTLSGLTVEGITNSVPGTVFDFTGPESLVADGGQARIEASDGAFTSLFIEPEAANTWFSAFEANIEVLRLGRGQHASGTLTVTAYDKFGVATVAQHAISSQGSNFFNIQAIAPDLIRSILIESTVSLGEVRQIRVGGFEVEPPGSPGAQVPEPVALLLLGAGLLAVGRRLRGLRSPARIG